MNDALPSGHLMGPSEWRKTLDAAERPWPLPVDRVVRGDSVVHRDPRGYYRWIVAVVMAALSLLFVPSLFITDHPDATTLRVMAAGTIVFCLFGTWWCWRAGSIRLGPRGIREYGCYRPYFWAWAELDRASVEVLIPPMKAVKCRALIIHTKNGKSHLAWCTLASPKDGDASWVDFVAHEINERIAAGDPIGPN